MSALEQYRRTIDIMPCSKTCGYGPGPFFGEQILKSQLCGAVGLVPCAVGGTSIDQWKPGGKLFNQMVESLFS